MSSLSSSSSNCVSMSSVSPSSSYCVSTSFDSSSSSNCVSTSSVSSSSSNCVSTSSVSSSSSNCVSTSSVSSSSSNCVSTWIVVLCISSGILRKSGSTALHCSVYIHVLQDEVLATFKDMYKNRIVPKLHTFFEDIPDVPLV